ncbi:hypothetical protein TNIN_44001 [Trichonephila inaurata madagascariensis]|uniref:Uncharacterized protein n=1 Tax=Trichonephila inaurata madagascariensis TaxID=2747483 RepID=A0A8X6XAY1_9ARAC|nr:hypothetical protein TNIN_44001 [Trichonephila inaurata madagascariensis]
MAEIGGQEAGARGSEHSLTEAEEESTVGSVCDHANKRDGKNSQENPSGKSDAEQYPGSSHVTLPPTESEEESTVGSVCDHANKRDGKNSQENPSGKSDAEQYPRSSHVTLPPMQEILSNYASD